MAVKDDDERDEEERDEDERDEDDAAESPTGGERESPPPEEPADEASERAASAPPPADEGPSPDARPAPLWVVPLYVGGLVLFYLGERVFEPMPNGHWIATGLGALAVIGATVIRFMPKYRVGGERRDIEKLLGVLSVLGVVALVIYFTTTDWGWEKLGLVKMEPDTQERVRGILQILWITLIAVSVLPMLFAEGALLPMRHAERPEARRVRAAAVSGLTLVIAMVYGALFVYSADKIDAKVDYSYFKTSRPSESTRKIAESLTEPLDVVAFFPQVNDIKTEVDRYLSELARGIPNLKIEVQDRLLVPKRAKDLKVTQDGVIVLSKGGVTETLNIGVDEKNARPKLKTLDRDFQERLLKIVRSRRVAYLTVGHGELNDPSQGEGGERNERAVKIARTLLQKQNYLVKDLGLGQGLASEVPDDADVVFVMGPTEPFSPEELSSLKRYGDRGGRFFIALDPDAIQWAEAAGVAGGEPVGGEPGEPPTPASAQPAPSGSAPKPPGSAKPAGSAKPPGSAKPNPAASVPKPASSVPKPVASAPKPAGSAPKPVASAPKPASSAPKAGDSTPPPTDGAKPPSGLAALARIVGLDFSPVLLENDKQHVRRRYNDSDRTLLVTNRFSSHASVSTLSRNSSRAAVALFGSGSLERASGATEKVDFSIKSVAGTYPDANRNYKPDPDEKPSTYNLAAAVTKPRTAEPLKKKPAPAKDKKDDDKNKKDKKVDEDEMRAFVIADADALTDVVLANVVGNQVLLVDAVRWLGGEESWSGEVNTEEDIRIEHTKQKDLVWFYATIFGAPALILGLGLAYSRRARRAAPKGGRS